MICKDIFMSACLHSKSCIWSNLAAHKQLQASSQEVETTVTNVCRMFRLRHLDDSVVMPSGANLFRQLCEAHILDLSLIMVAINRHYPLHSPRDGVVQISQNADWNVDKPLLRHVYRSIAAEGPYICAGNAGGGISRQPTRFQEE